jgi:hypothetical protein
VLIQPTFSIFAFSEEGAQKEIQYLEEFFLSLHFSLFGFLQIFNILNAFFFLNIVRSEEIMMTHAEWEGLHLEFHD